MNAEIIGCCDRGKYSATLTDDALAALNALNGSGTNTNTPSDPDNGSDSNTNKNSKEYDTPVYFHPPYVI